MQKKKSKKQSHVAAVTAISAGAAALAAAGYFFLGPQGKKHQKQARAWAIKMKGDVVEKLEKARTVTEPLYHQAIDAVAHKYGKRANVSKQEIIALSKELKRHWKTISASGQPAKRASKKSTSKKKR